ncbi:MAG: DUF480 domain-containing protein [Candidatus Thiodiazotropha sp. L084R]
MLIELTTVEARIIGSLLEKEITTPDQYPLSLSALTHACNQKSSRDPVLQLTDGEVQNSLDDLKKKHLVSDRSGFGSRVTKFQHRFCNLGFGSLELTPQELGVICVLLLRGAQTPGELRSRTNRLCEFSDVQETESVLVNLMQREDGPFVMRLTREPGKRESRFAHLFSGEVVEGQTLSLSDPLENQLPQDDQLRIERLESEVEILRQELDALKDQLGVN